MSDPSVDAVEALGDQAEVPEPSSEAVKTGKAGLGGSREDRLKEEAVSVRHLLTHLPKNPYCPACQAGKLVKVHHRRKVPEEEVDLPFGEKCTADTLYAHGERSQGRYGENTRW